LISDIHGNLEALESVIEKLGEEGVDKVVCLGDLVGYGADPNECIRRVRRLTDLVVAGNHDWAAVGRLDTTYFNPHARSAIYWTSKKLTRESYDYLLGLPLTLELEGVVMVHATPSRPGEWHYILSPEEAFVEFAAFTARAAFIGHSHSPAVFYQGERTGVIDHKYPFVMEPGKRYIVNIGSVGQPRDGDPRASYAVYDSSTGEVAIRRVEYDVASAQKKILESGISPFLAYRLALGR